MTDSVHPEHKDERRKLSKIEAFKELLLSNAQLWQIAKSFNTLYNFFVILRPIVKGNGYNYVTELNGDTQGASDFIKNKDMAWKKCAFEALEKGFTKGDWDDFANLDIIMIDSRTFPSVSLKLEQFGLAATAKSWNEVYKGRSHQLLWEHITNYYMKSEGSELYANMCAIVQSSGMGKSRMINELGKNHFLIPINLRDCDSGYPPPDVEVREYLTGQDLTEKDLMSADQARGRCFVFLYGLFKQTLLELQHAKQKRCVSTKQEMTEWFHDQISPPEKNKFRCRFFQGVLSIAKQHGSAAVTKNDAEPKRQKNRQNAQLTVQKSWRKRRAAVEQKNVTGRQGKAEREIITPQRITRSTTKKTQGAQVDRNKETVEEGTVDRRSTADEAGKSLNDMLVESAQELVKFLRCGDTGDTQDEVEVVLSFDEAHVLCDAIRYDPKAGQLWSMFVMFRETLRCLYTVPVWSLFLSTTGKLSQFNPHHGIDPSMRIREETYKTVPAFTTLRYDLFAPRIRRTKDGTLRHCEEWDNTGSPPRKKAKGSLRGKSLTLADVTKTKFIVKFGRPLFYLMWHHGKDTVQTDIVRFAMSKLICEDPAKLTTDWKSAVPVQVAFACLSQRLCIEFNTSKYNTDEETQITSHMRLCLKIGSDNQFIMSSSGSEPLLAEAASTIMQMDVFKAAESLKHVVSGFAINKGDRGELVALLAVTRARDLAVKQKVREIGFSGPAGVLPVSAEESKPVFRAVTVQEFLSQLFSLDKLKKTDLRDLSRDFKDAYVYFNHFVRPFDRSTCTLRFLLQYMTRGAAVLCSSNMPGIDALFGILFESEEGIVLREDRTSIVLFQAKNDPHIKRHLHEGEIMKGIEDIASRILKDSSDPRPVIRIIFSLGSPPELCYSKSTITLQNGKSVTAHDFWCGGIGNFFLPEDDESKSTWEALLSTTMKSKELFGEKDPRFEVFKEERMSLCPGGSQAVSFWSWIEDLDDDIEESYIEENSVEEKQKQKAKKN